MIKTIQQNKHICDFILFMFLGLWETYLHVLWITLKRTITSRVSLRLWKRCPVFTDRLCRARLRRPTPWNNVICNWYRCCWVLFGTSQVLSTCKIQLWMYNVFLCVSIKVRECAIGRWLYWCMFIAGDFRPVVETTVQSTLSSTSDSTTVPYRGIDYDSKHVLNVFYTSIQIKRLLLK